jgi:hypothetical protein
MARGPHARRVRIRSAFAERSREWGRTDWLRAQSPVLLADGERTQMLGRHRARRAPTPRARAHREVRQGQRVPVQRHERSARQGPHHALGRRMRSSGGKRRLSESASRPEVMPRMSSTEGLRGGPSPP